MDSDQLSEIYDLVIVWLGIVNDLRDNVAATHFNKHLLHIKVFFIVLAHLLIFNLIFESVIIQGNIYSF